MRFFKDYSRHIRSTRREIVREYLLPLLVEFLILGVSMAAFMFSVRLGPMIQEQAVVGDSVTMPTAGRFVFGIVALIMWFVFSWTASKAAKEDRHYASSLLGFSAGIFLWQFIGEITWHFSVGGVHFVPFESVTTFPLACMVILLMVYGKRHHSFDWGIWCMLLSFVMVWMGHYVMEGTYPFVESFVEERTWSVCISITSGTLGLIFSIVFLLFRVKTRRGRILASMVTYISLGVITFGLLEG